MRPRGFSLTTYISPRRGGNQWSIESRLDYLYIARNEERKGYGIYIPNKGLDIANKRVRNVKTLTSAQNEQIGRFLLEVEETPTALIHPVNESGPDMRGMTRYRGSYCTCNAYGTRTITQKAKVHFQVK